MWGFSGQKPATSRAFPPITCKPCRLLHHRHEPAGSVAVRVKTASIGPFRAVFSTVSYPHLLFPMFGALDLESALPPAFPPKLRPHHVGKSPYRRDYRRERHNEISESCDRAVFLRGPVSRSEDAVHAFGQPPKEIPGDGKCKESNAAGQERRSAASRAVPVAFERRIATRITRVDGDPMSSRPRSEGQRSGAEAAEWLSDRPRRGIGRSAHEIAPTRV